MFIFSSLLNLIVFKSLTSFTYYFIYYPRSCTSLTYCSSRLTQQKYRLSALENNMPYPWKHWMTDGEKVNWGMGVNIDMISPEAWDEWEPDLEAQQEARQRVTGWLLPPIASSIWAAAFTRQSDNLLYGMAYRAKAVYEHL
ncbi:hypothetical protein F5X99DRAFT_381800 [Biscogniauxia marginata]|nr:hypothetical protein F5X99DRAFT_381800 [Biscogniauxia marginata]